MSLMPPQVSVVMPVYNARAYLGDALDSVLQQTLGDFELILIDDGSTDGSTEILQEAARKDGRIRLVSRPNKGIIETLNEGLALVQGRYVARMDADDVAVADRFARQVEWMDGHPACSAVGSQVLFIDADGEPIAPKSDTKYTHAEIDAALLAGQWPMVHPSVMMRAESLRRIGGYREYRTWEDHDLFLRLAEVGELANLPAVLLRYRLHQGSIVHQREADKSPVMTAILQAAAQRRGGDVNDVPHVPGRGCVTRLTHQRNWAWWALAAGNTRTARKHAWGAWRKAPLAMDSWRLLACALRGH